MQRSSAEMELEETTVKLNQLSIRRQQLNERHAILTMLKNFRHQTGRGIIGKSRIKFGFIVCTTELL